MDLPGLAPVVMKSIIYEIRVIIPKLFKISEPYLLISGLYFFWPHQSVKQITVVYHDLIIL